MMESLHKNDPFKRFLLISLALHASALIISLLGDFFYPKAEIKFERAIRVDMIGLPDKVTPAQPEPKRSPPPVAAPTPTPTPPAPEPVKPSRPAAPEPKTKAPAPKAASSAQSALNRIEQMAALEALEQSLEQERIQNAKLREMVFKGNVIADGNSLTGLNKIEAEDYVGNVEAHVRSFWKLPQWLAVRPYRAKALVKWDSQGIPVLIQIIESSGNDQFDEIVMQTIQNATPLPEPPEKFAQIMRRQGVVFGFPE